MNIIYIFTLLLIYNISGFVGEYNGVIVCNNDPCSFTLMEQTAYVCGCNVTSCILEAYQQNGKEILLVSFAKITQLICYDKDSCQNAKVYINPERISFLAAFTSFLTCNPMKATVLCQDEGSCKDINITSNGVETTVFANGLNSFDEASFQCIDTPDCILKCSDNKYTCEDAICGENCNCQGLLCPDRTEVPTKSPVIETEEPTYSESPTLSPVIETEEPTYSESPTISPVIETEEPTMSEEPTKSPVMDTDSPTLSESPTISPTTPKPTLSPVIETDSPTLSPTITKPIILMKEITINDEDTINTDTIITHHNESIIASIIISGCFIVIAIIALTLYSKFDNKSDNKHKLIDYNISNNYNSTDKSFEIYQL